MGSRPEPGNLAPDSLASLLVLLASATANADDCYFCLWDGYGWITGAGVSVLALAQSPQTDPGRAPASFGVPPAFSAEELSRPRVQLPRRSYLLQRGPLRAAAQIGWRPRADWFIPQSPNIFWPADQSWCVATEIDFDSTLVGGSVELIEAVLHSPQLDAWAVKPSDSLAFGGDKVNPPPHALP